MEPKEAGKYREASKVIVELMKFRCDTDY